MKTGDRVFGFICLGLSLWLIIEALRYDYIVRFTPGPGFAPLWIGVALGLFSLYKISETYWRKNGKEAEKPILTKQGFFARVGPAILVLAVYTLTLTSIGFLLGTVALVFIILYFLEKYSLIKSLLYSVAFAGGAFVFFRYVMEVHLPKSGFGFGYF